MEEQDDSPRRYLLRMFMESGEMIELQTIAPDDKMALDLAEKGYGREFKIVDEGLGMKIIEEVRNE